MYFLLNKDLITWEVFDDFGESFRSNAEKIAKEGYLPDWSSYIEIIKDTEEVIFHGSATDCIQLWLDHEICYSILINI